MSYTMTMTQEQGPNFRSNDVRSRRIGGNVPYRDDPVRFVQCKQNNFFFGVSYLFIYYFLVVYICVRIYIFGSGFCFFLECSSLLRVPW